MTSLTRLASSIFGLSASAFDLDGQHDFDLERKMTHLISSISSSIAATSFRSLSILAISTERHWRSRGTIPLCLSVDFVLQSRLKMRLVLPTPVSIDQYVPNITHLHLAKFMIPLRIERVLPGSGRSKSVMTSVFTPHTRANVRLKSVTPQHFLLRGLTSVGRTLRTVTHLRIYPDHQPQFQLQNLLDAPSSPTANSLVPPYSPEVSP
jgi:hypothetical protein